MLFIYYKSNITPQKTVGIMNIMEQMVEIRKWKAMQGIGSTDGKCRLCGQYDETVQNLLPGCKILPGAEYLCRHNNALMALTVVGLSRKYFLLKAQYGRERDGKRDMDLKRAGTLNTKMGISAARRPDLTLDKDIRWK